MARTKLAIHGGGKAVPDGLMKSWPPVDQTDRDLIMGSLDRQEYTYGTNYKALEREFGEWLGITVPTVFCNSGTAALHMAVVACGCGVGDEVIAPSFTFVSTAQIGSAAQAYIQGYWDCSASEEVCIPSTRTAPEEGNRRPLVSRARVDFPDPLEPTSPTCSPPARRRSMPSRSGAPPG